MRSAIESGTAFGIDQKFVINNMVLTAQGEKLKPKRKPRNRVAKHEALHIDAAEENGTNVIAATIEPNYAEGYLGATWMDREDPVAAMAPAVYNMDGVWGDEESVRSRGHNPNALKGSARSIVDDDRVDALAVVLEDEKTISGSRIKQVRKDAKAPIFETATVFVQSLEGDKTEITGVEVRDNIVMMPNIWYVLAQRDNKPQIH